MYTAKVEVRAEFCWDFPISKYIEGIEGNSQSLDMSKEMILPNLVCPFVIMPSGPEWLEHMVAERWVCYETINREPRYALWCEPAGVDLDQGRDQFLGDIRSLLDSGWEFNCLPEQEEAIRKELKKMLSEVEG